MKTDVLVLGAELDAWTAALRLRELGHSVTVLTSGAGSLHYASGGIHLLGYAGGDDAEPVRSPLESIHRLETSHPYRLCGDAATADALEWFFETAEHLELQFRRNGTNATAIAAGGPPLPVYGPAKHEATHDRIGTRVTLVQFSGHRDFPAALVAASLRSAGCDIEVIETPGPGGMTESVALARVLDDPGCGDSFFRDLKRRLPSDPGVIGFPAVLGLGRHHSVAEQGERCLAAPCLELATLPPSVPGMRLHHALEARSKRIGVRVLPGAGFGGGQLAHGRCEAVMDRMGRAHAAAVFVVATGGVLMGGLEVQSCGEVRECTMGLPVSHQRVLAAENVDQSLDGLHRAGVETDADLRPLPNGSAVPENVFVCGRTLAHWNPAVELSAEGVSIVTGWIAAERAHEHLRDS